MKKHILIFFTSIAFLAIVFTLSFSVKELYSKHQEPERVIFQNELYPVKVIETNGHTRILWVQAKNKRTVNLSFYANPKTVDEILYTLKSRKKK